MNEDIEFIILVTGRFHWLVKPVLYFYDKYMPVSLLFFSDRPIDGCNARRVFPLNMSIYKEPCGHIVKRALQEIDKPLVMFGYMDILPTHKVDLRSVDKLGQFMITHPTIARGNLWSEVSAQIANYGKVVWEDNSLSILELPRGNPGLGGVSGTHLMPALWRRDFLLDFIEDQWTFDAIEIPGQYKFEAQDKWYSVGTLPGLYDICHLCYTADTREARLSTIQNMEDRAYVAQFVPEGYRIT